MKWMWQVFRRLLGKLCRTPPGSRATGAPNADRLITVGTRVNDIEVVTSVATVTPPGIAKLAALLAEHTFE